jgi:tRNA G37 N-methylase Trm5
MRGTVHVYRILEQAEEADAVIAIRSAVHEVGLRTETIRSRHVRAYSPTQHHVAFDVTVARA